MVGKFMILPVGKKQDKSKSGKTEYWFANGVKTSNSSLLDKCQCFNFWSSVEFEGLEFMKPVEAVCEVSGNFVRVVEIFGHANEDTSNFLDDIDAGKKPKNKSETT